MNYNLKTIKIRVFIRVGCNTNLRAKPVGFKKPLQRKKLENLPKSWRDRNCINFAINTKESIRKCRIVLS